MSKPIKCSIFISIVLILSIFITNTAASNKIKQLQEQNNNLEQNIEDIKNIPPGDESGKQLENIFTTDEYSTYNQNDLNIIEITDTINNVECNYIQIEGLKDKELEKKLNKLFIDTIKENIKGIDEIDNVYMYTCSNFSNILSVRTNIYYNDYCNSKYICLNIDLTTGNLINFDDLFTEDANIHDLVRTAIYNYYVLEYKYADETRQSLEESEEQDEDYYDDYDELYEAVDYIEGESIEAFRRFMNSKEKKFTISPEAINIYVGDFCYNIDIISNLDCIKIYSAYKTEESIFNNENYGFKNLIVGQSVYNEMYDYYKTEFVDDNFYYNTFLLDDMYYDKNSTLPEDAKKFIKSFDGLKEKERDSINAKIETYKELAKNDKENFYILLIRDIVIPICLNEYEYGETEEDYNVIYHFSPIIKHKLYTYTYKIPTDLYESKYKDILFEKARYPFNDYDTGRGFHIDAEKDIDYEEYIYDEFVDLYEDKQDIDVQDFIIKDADAMEIIKESIYNAIFYFNSEKVIEKDEVLEEIEEKLKAKDYDFDEYGLSMNLSNDIYVYLGFHEIDLEYLRH